MAGPACLSGDNTPAHIALEVTNALLGAKWIDDDDVDMLAMRKHVKSSQANQNLKLAFNCF